MTGGRGGAGAGEWRGEGVRLHLGDCLDVMRGMEAGSVDAVITDPPYGLEFMGKDWDHGVPGVPFWKAALRVAKPGAFLLAFGGTRTHHRLMVAIEDAGWEIRDVIMWVYGSGFPKSHDISKAIDKEAGEERKILGKSKYAARRSAAEGYGGFTGKDHRLITEAYTPEAQQWDGWGTALKPAWEPIIVAMKPVDGTFANNALQHGTAGLWIDGCRVDGPGWTKQDGDSGAGFKTDKYMGSAGRGEPTQKYGYRESKDGRWPANLIHDGSDEVLEEFDRAGERGQQVAPGYGRNAPKYSGNTYNSGKPGGWEYERVEYTDSGTAARFFYCAKAGKNERNLGLEGMPEQSTAEREGRRHNNNSKHGYKDGKTWERKHTTAQQNHHPTVKPLALMEYLCRLTRTPTGGMVLDPFMGSGTTGMGAVLTRRDFIGIEIDEKYFEIAKRRIEWAKKQPIQLELWDVEA